MASGRTGIMVNLSEDALTWYDGERYGRRNRIPGIAALRRAFDAFRDRCLRAGKATCGVQFKPGGAFAFFGGSAREFANAHVSLADIWGANAHSLHQRLVEAPTPDAKIAILFRAMVDRHHDIDRHPAVALALSRFARAPHRTSVRAVAREAEVSAKRLIHLFAEQVGMTPKLYLRVSRFQRVLARVHIAPRVDWMEEVEHHGYYDQPHFIREFREFSGFTPTEYFRLRGPYLQHVPLTV